MPFKDQEKRKKYEKERWKTPENRLRRQNQAFKSRYNFSLEEYNKLFKEQEGKCAICKVHQSELNRVLYLDHNHTTNKVRGLLCQTCNSAIGFLKDSPLICKNASIYLDKHGETI